MLNDTTEKILNLKEKQSKKSLTQPGLTFDPSVETGIDE
jgi:hypothetical protein